MNWHKPYQSAWLWGLSSGHNQNLNRGPTWDFKEDGSGYAPVLISRAQFLVNFVLSDSSPSLVLGGNVSL